jgi:CheY-like chemotaxis protein
MGVNINMETQKPILLVEDDSVDAMTVKRALKDVGANKTIAHTTNGEDALNYLRDESNKKPCLIFLDLNMPKMDGIEFLKIIKNEGSLRSIPVIVLTTSKNAHDIIESFQLSVAGYMVKPVDYNQFVQTMGAIKDYWSLSRMPDK